MANRAFRKALFLCLRRSSAFLIDIISIVALIFLIECTVGFYLAFLTDYNPRQAHGLLENFFVGGDLHLLLIPLLLGVSTSSLFSGRSLGSRVMRIRVVSAQSKWMSLVGCVIRAFWVLAPPFLYFFLVLVPFAFRQVRNGFGFPQLEFTILIWFFLAVPVSIVWGRGQQGIHDYILNIRVVNERSADERKYFFSSELTVLGFIISTTVLSIVLVLLVQKLNFVQKWQSQLAPFAARYTDPSNESEALVLAQSFKINLDEPPFRDKVMDWAVVLASSSASEVLDSGVTVRSYSHVPKVKISLGGNGTRKLKETLSEIGNKLTQSDIDYKYLIVDCERVMIIDIFYFYLKGYCFYQKGVSKPIGCSGIAGLAPLVWNWSAQVPILR